MLQTSHISTYTYQQTQTDTHIHTHIHTHTQYYNMKNIAPENAKHQRRD